MPSIKSKQTNICCDIYQTSLFVDYNKMQQFQFLPIFFYFIPDELAMHYQGAQVNQNDASLERRGASQQKIEVNQKQKRRMYLEIFQKELVKSKSKYEKKCWKPQQDDLLIELREKSLGWVQISKNIQKANPQICKRRYLRLTEMRKTWPKSLDESIKSLFERQNKSLQEIQQILSTRPPQFMNYSFKKIKERYCFHLRQGINNSDWEIQEDLELLALVQENGKKWKQLAKKFVGRTQLQLKNRFNGTLKLIEKRVMRKLNHILRKNRKAKMQ